MAKRLSTGQSNTLFNYFQSPKAAKKEESKPLKGSPKIINELKDDSPVKLKKRKVISIIDSDSEDDSPTPMKKRPLEKKSSSEEEEDRPQTKEAAKKIVKKIQDAVKEIKDDVHGNWLHNRLDFLKSQHIRDVNGKRPDDPDYDNRTVYVPKSFLDDQTPAMRQWWVLKSTHMDSVMFFKVGKFYELYHMDAVVGVTQLGFSYMKGEFAHSGFPESAYHKMANMLIEKGYKVIRTEQTETPEMMNERCKKKQGKTTKFDKVVKREICQISTKASCVYTAQMPDAMHSLACYMYAIAEKDITSNEPHFGICFIDTSIGTFHMAEFDDDKFCSKLLVVLARYSPGLILTEKNKISPKLQEILNNNYKDVRRESLASESQFYSANKTVDKLLSGNYFRQDDQVDLPQQLKDITNGYEPKSGYELTLKALGASLWYLNDSKLDIQLLSLGKFEFYQPEDMQNTNQNYMILDSVTMQNLNLLGGAGTLQKQLNHCRTAFGKRLLQQWICRPLCNVDQIRERQEAIQELHKNSVVFLEAQSVLKGLPDLERQLTKLHTFGNKVFAMEHPDSRAIFYEAATYSKRQIMDLLNTLKGFEKAQNLCPIFGSCQSALLKRITQFPPKGIYPDLDDHLCYFKNAFNQEEAKNNGKIIPEIGIDDAYDRAEATIQDIKNRLEDYLAEQQKFFGCKVTYFGNDKKRFQLEIPDSHTKRITTDYQMEGAKKGTKPAKRYSTPQTRQLLSEMLKAEAERGRIIQDLNRRIFEKFSQRWETWEEAIKCLAILDVLCALAEYARRFGGDVCMPIVEPMTQKHKLVVRDGRHPCISNIVNFVPNDITMDLKDNPSLLLLTGPNMGGKSTLMRQLAVICVMAQMGSFVPASSCNLTAIDRIFTRLGANDDIIAGKSTFLVELSEASTILKHASPFSLVIIDELGRGTSTYDGTAIATAYVDKLTTINCRGLFSTHYHSLVDHFENRRDVQLSHMACMVENDDDDPTIESVTFLYKIAKGRCPKSYGFNVARLAGLEQNVVARARALAKILENENKNRQLLRQIFTNDLLNLKKKLSELVVF